MTSNKLIVLLFAMLLIFSCGDDSPESVVGTYILVDVELLDGCDEPEIQNASVQNGCLMIGGESTCITFILSENGIAQAIIVNVETETNNLTYTVNESSGVITLCDGSDCNDFTISGDMLRFQFLEEGFEIVYVFERV